MKRLKSTVQGPKTTPRSGKSVNRTAAARGGGGDTMGGLVRKSNRWRENYSALRGLAMARVVSVLEAGARGDYAELQWLYQSIERRFPILRSLILRRRSALMKFDWDIKVVSEMPEGGTEAMAEAQKKYLRSRYELIGNLRAAIKFLALAEFRGYAHLNKHRNGTGAVVELHWLPQWNFIRDGMFGDWYWNPEATAGATAQSLGESNRIDPEDFIIREVEMPVNEIAAIAYVRSGLSQKDWDAFVEIFGLSGCVVTMPPNVPAGKEAEYETAALQVAEGGSGAIPSGATATFPSASVRSSAPFKEHLEYQKEDVVLAGTGGKLAMLTAPTGLNSSQGEGQQDAFDGIAQAEAKEISELFQEEFDCDELDRKFPGQPHLVYFEIAAKDEEDTAALVDQVSKLETCGLKTDEEEIGERLGMKLTRAETGAGPGVGGAGDPKSQIRNPKSESGDPEDTEDPRMMNRTTSPAEDPSQAENDLFLQGVAADLAMLRERISKIVDIQDETLFRDRVQSLLDEFDRLAADITADPESGSALARVMVTGGVNALAEAARSRAAAGNRKSEI